MSIIPTSKKKDKLSVNHISNDLIDQLTADPEKSFPHINNILIQCKKVHALFKKKEKNQ